MYSGSGIDHSGSQGKSIDVGYPPVNRIIRNISQLISFTHRCRQGSHQEFCLIGSGIIGADRRIGYIYRTVKHTNLWIFHCCLDTLRCHLGRCGKNHIAARSHGQRNILSNLTVCRGIVKYHGLQPSSIFLFQIHPPQLMSVNPAGAFPGLWINKCDFQHLRFNIFRALQPVKKLHRRFFLLHRLLNQINSVSMGL